MAPGKRKECGERKKKCSLQRTREKLRRRLDRAALLEGTNARLVFSAGESSDSQPENSEEESHPENPVAESQPKNPVAESQPKNPVAESQPKNSEVKPRWKMPAWLLIEEGDVSRTDEHGRSTLHDAAMRGQVQRMRRLIARGADPRLRDLEGLTPLYWALSEGWEEAAELLVDLDCGNDVEDGGGRTPLHWAAMRGFAEVVTRLLVGGAETRVRDGWGRTPLHLALGHRREAAAELIVEADGGVDLRDERGRTPLHYAAHEGFKKIVARLLQKDVNPHVRDDEGRYPIQLALRWGWDDAIPKMILSIYALRDIAVDWGKMGLALADLRSCLEELSRCTEEIRRMKEAGEPSLSFHDLMTGHVSRVARRLPDELVRGMSVMGIPSRPNAALHFPRYVDLVAQRLRSAHGRRVSTDRCERRFSRLSPKLPPLPVTCTDVILLCLSEEDMGNFLRASQPPTPK